MRLTDQPIIDALKAGEHIRRSFWHEGRFAYVKNGKLYDEVDYPLLFAFDLLEATDWKIVENE